MEGRGKKRGGCWGGAFDSIGCVIETTTSAFRPSPLLSSLISALGRSNSGEQEGMREAEREGRDGGVCVCRGGRVMMMMRMMMVLGMVGVSEKRGEEEEEKKKEGGG